MLISWIKMEKLFNEMIAISFENSKTHEFYEFVKEVHEMIWCDKPDCDITLF